MDDSDRRLWSAILILALPPAIALMWFLETPASSTTTSMVDSLLAAAYAFGLFVSFLFVLAALLVFNFFADLWSTLIEDHRTVTARRRAGANAEPRRADPAARLPP